MSAAATKQLLWQSPAPDSAEIDHLERAWHLALMGGPDAAEGVQAFLDKRDPRWSGRLDGEWPPEGTDPV